MNRTDFLRIVRGGQDVDYAPVAGLLTTGYGFAGYFNSRLNEDMEDTCILVNARLVDLQGSPNFRTQPHISDFNEFVEEIVLQGMQANGDVAIPQSDVYGKSIPLVVIPFDKFAVLYPVGQMGKMMKDLEREQNEVPSFLDFNNKSVVLKLLRAKLW